MTIYENVGADAVLASANEYRLEEYIRRHKEGKKLVTVTSLVLRVFVAGQRTDMLIDIEKEKGFHHYYPRLRMSLEDQQHLSKFFQNG